MKISWYGNASLKIESDNTKLLIDPFVPLAPSTIPVTLNDYYGVDTILVTHGHFDHIDNVPELCKKSQVKVFTTKTPANTLMAEGVSSQKIQLITLQKSFVVGDITITPYQTRHIKIDYLQAFEKQRLKQLFLYFGQAFSMYKKLNVKKENGEIVGFMLESEGRSIFVLGSLGLDDKVQYPESMDLLVLPYQGSRHILDISVQIIDRLKPRAVLLDHYDDAFPPVTKNVDTSDLINRYKGKIPVLEIPYKTPISV